MLPIKSVIFDKIDKTDWKIDKYRFLTTNPFIDFIDFRYNQLILSIVIECYRLPRSGQTTIWYQILIINRVDFVSLNNFSKSSKRVISADADERMQLLFESLQNNKKKTKQENVHGAYLSVKSSLFSVSKCSKRVLSICWV